MDDNIWYNFLGLSNQKQFDNALKNITSSQMNMLNEEFFAAEEDDEDSSKFICRFFNALAHLNLPIVVNHPNLPDFLKYAQDDNVIRIIINKLGGKSWIDKISDDKFVTKYKYYSLIGYEPPEIYNKTGEKLPLTFIKKLPECKHCDYIVSKFLTHNEMKQYLTQKQYAWICKGQLSIIYQKNFNHNLIVYNDKKQPVGFILGDIDGKVARISHICALSCGRCVFNQFLYKVRDKGAQIIQILDPITRVFDVYKKWGLEYDDEEDMFEGKIKNLI